MYCSFRASSLVSPGEQCFDLNFDLNFGTTIKVRLFGKDYQLLDTEIMVILWIVMNLGRATEQSRIPGTEMRLAK